MTEEELAKVPFQMVAHMAMEKEHTCTYSSKDGRLGFCDHTRKKGGYEFGRTYRHYRFDSQVFTNKKDFLKAIKDYIPSTAPPV